MVYMAPGTFRDAEGKVVDEPAPLALAKADTVGVVEPDGLPALTGRTSRPPTVEGARGAK
jgi:hypothetical protein